MNTHRRVHRLEFGGPAETGMPEMECDPEDFASDLPTQTLHEYYNDPELGMSVGVWTTSPMQEAYGPYPGDEFIWLLEGGFRMVDGDNETLDQYHVGEMVYFHNAAPVSWVQEEHLRKFYITYLNPNRPIPDDVEPVGAVKAINLAVAEDQMTELREIDGLKFVGDAPTMRFYEYYTNHGGDMEAGLFQSSRFETEMAPYPTHELVRMLEGEVAISEPDGTTNHFGPDDCFFVPQGTMCSWKTDGPIKKVYCTLIET